MDSVTFVRNLIKHTPYYVHSFCDGSGTIMVYNFNGTVDVEIVRYFAGEHTVEQCADGAVRVVIPD
jgi:hypothetical protein